MRDDIQINGWSAPNSHLLHDVAARAGNGAALAAAFSTLPFARGYMVVDGWWLVVFSW